MFRSELVGTQAAIAVTATNMSRSGVMLAILASGRFRELCYNQPRGTPLRTSNMAETAASPSDRRGVSVGLGSRASCLGTLPTTAGGAIARQCRSLVPAPQLCPRGDWPG